MSGVQTEWQKYVIKSLEDLKKSQNDLREDMYKNKISNMERLADIEAGIRRDLADFKMVASQDISVLKVKSGVWGAIAGIIPATIAIVLTYLKLK